MMVVEFDSGAGLGVKGGDGDISSSLYLARQTDRTQHQQPISAEGREEKQSSEREIFICF